MIAGLHVGDLLADLLDDARGLVPEDRRRGPHVEAVDEMEVAVAYAARDDFDANLAILRLVDIDILDFQRLIGSVEDCCFHLMLLDVSR